jgi:hypothetical protein
MVEEFIANNSIKEHPKLISKLAKFGWEIL